MESSTNELRDNREMDRRPVVLKGAAVAAGALCGASALGLAGCSTPMADTGEQTSMDELMKAAKYYTKTTGRRITFEYSLVKGVNDKKEHAEELISRVKGMNCHINLIPVNPIKERDFEQSTQNNVTAFKHILERQHIQVTVRREMGRDIDGACGQLRKRYMGS